MGIRETGRSEYDENDDDLPEPQQQGPAGPWRENYDTAQAAHVDTNPPIVPDAVPTRAAEVPTSAARYPALTRTHPAHVEGLKRADAVPADFLRRSDPRKDSAEAAAEHPQTPADGSPAHERRETASEHEDQADDQSSSQQEATRDMRRRAIQAVTDAAAQLRHLLDEQEELKQQLTQAVQDAGLAESPEQLLTDLDQLAALLEDQRANADPDRQSRQALALAAYVTAIMNDAQDIADAVTSTAPGSALAKAVDRILKLIKRAARWIFSLIARMATPKEWTLQTQLSLPGLGQASISITFG
jgi:hypothetical protein